MQLNFRNSYGPRIWVAIMFYDPSGCGAYGSWGTRGWWAIDYGASAYVLNTNNRYAYYYAEAADGAVWAGSYGPIYVPQTAFSSCLGIGQTNARIVGLREVYIASDNHTVNLTP
ncbi:hypothetical protein BBK14_18845 [Parafrankia soli]|uniref:DUF1036 domain-containing protein n=1 Tax=Parafrankia soli TaxID=2599596 RepID=A0A1S1Q1J3_9ACTN|nr:DUF1036 domain-containing protein [Parafrankia soli]OHV27850.1 hypothetical protein BBK14_18845 [Parafrankia soli]